MRLLILHADYPEFLRWLYAPGPEKRSYEEQMQVPFGSFFGVADFYSGNLPKIGYQMLAELQERR